MKLNLDVIIFDIDGILINVSQSYRNAIRETVQIYLEKCLGLGKSEQELVTHDDVTAFKLVGGFNNDWDLTTGLLKYFLSLLAPQPLHQISPDSDSSKILSFLSSQNLNFSLETLREKKDIPSFTSQLKQVGTGLTAVWQILGNKNDHLLFAEGDILKTNLVQRIFQEIYLGIDLFKDKYQVEPLLYQQTGLIQKESLIINPEILAKIAQKVKLGVATGRPKHEAIYTLNHVGILPYFQSIVTHDDKEIVEQKIYQETGEKISLGKPHPYTLLTAVKAIANHPVKCAYIGDLPDDVKAANAAKSEIDFVSIGCLEVAEDRQLMQEQFTQVGADIILDHPDQLWDLIN
jgi:HAD superfamily phosphatase